MDDCSLAVRKLEDRTQKLERRLRVSAGGCLLLAVLVVCAWTWRATREKAISPPSLKVSELVVVDPNGVERVRIGGNVPDAVINGKRIPRGEKAAGVLLYDETGQER